MSDSFSLLYNSDFKFKLKKICKGDKGFCNQIKRRSFLFRIIPNRVNP